MKRKVRGLPIAIGLMLVLHAASDSRADDADPAAAREHFERGLSHARKSEIDAAAREFEAAYRASPHFSVLYNLGQAYVLLGKPVEAVDALTRYLREGGGAVDRRRQVEVLATIEIAKKRIGSLRASIEPVTATLEIDGNAVDQNWRQDVISVSTGRHGLVVRAPGYVTQAMPVVLEPGEIRAFSVRLDPSSGRGSSESAQFGVSCGVPDVTVQVDERERGKTPLAMPVVVTPGLHRVRFSRLGYREVDTEVEATSERTPSVECALEPQRDLPAAERAALRVHASESDARVSIDGSPLSTGDLPLGKHYIEVRKFGFRTWVGDVTLSPGKAIDLHVDLAIEPEEARQYKERVQTQRTWAYALGAGGIALGGVATVLVLMSSAKYDAWRKQRDQLVANQSRVGTNEYAAQVGALQSSAIAVQRLDDWALGSAVLGGSALALGLTMFLAAGNPNRYEMPIAVLSSDSVSVAWARRW